MDLTPSALNGLFTNYALMYSEAYKGTAPWWRELATLVTSNTATQTYAWMDKIPKLRQWVGSRQIQNAAARSQLVTNLTFELTESLPREVLEDDQHGLYAPLAMQMGQQAAKWPDQRIITDVFTANPLSYDGVAFFSGSHKSNLEDSSVGTIDNLDAVALTLSNYAAARAKMMAYLGADGQPLGVMPNLLVVPPQLEGIARQILNSDFVADFIPGNTTAGNAGSSQNVWKGSARMLVIPELATAATTWYLFDTTQVVKPFVFQLRQAPEFAYLNKPTDPNVFWERNFVFGVHARGAATTSLPFLAYKSVG